MPVNGLACALPLLTKLLKPVYSTLRSKGHSSVGYIDDSSVKGNTIKNCNITSGNSSIVFLSGVCIAPWKPLSFPTQKLKFLGFILDSQPMVVILTPKRAVIIKQAVKRLVANPTPTIWELAEVISKFVVAFQGCVYGLSHYHQLDSDKINALKKVYGDYDCVILLENSRPHCKTVPKGLDLQGQNAVVVVVIRRTIADQKEWKDWEGVMCHEVQRERVSWGLFNVRIGNKRSKVNLQRRTEGSS